MNLGVVFGLTAAGGYGSADFVGGLAGRRHSTWQIVIVSQAVGAVVMAACGLLFPASPNPADFGWAVMAGVGSASGSLLLFRGLSSGHMSLVAPISAVGAAAVPVLWGMALGERPTWLSAAGLMGALPGIWLVSRGETSRTIAGGRRTAITCGAVAGVCFGVLFIALARMSTTSGTLPLAANQVVGGFVTLLSASVLRERWVPSRRTLGWGSAAGVLGVTGTLSFTVAARFGELGSTSVLASLYPAVTVSLAAIGLGERLGTRQRLGIGVCLLSVAALA